MEQEIPVLAAVDHATDIGELVKESNCGLSGYSGDLDEFVANILKLSLDPQMRKQMGINGRKYMEENFNIDVSVDRLEQHFSN